MPWRQVRSVTVWPSTRAAPPALARPVGLLLLLPPLPGPRRPPRQDALLARRRALRPPPGWPAAGNRGGAGRRCLGDGHCDAASPSQSAVRRSPLALPCPPSPWRRAAPGPSSRRTTPSTCRRASCLGGCPSRRAGRGGEGALRMLRGNEGFRPSLPAQHTQAAEIGVERLSLVCVCARARAQKRLPPACLDKRVASFFVDLVYVRDVAVKPR